MSFEPFLIAFSNCAQRDVTRCVCGRRVYAAITNMGAEPQCAAMDGEHAAEPESAALLRRLRGVEKRLWEAPTNFHHAAIAVCQDQSKPLQWRAGMMAGSALVILAQLLVIASTWVGIGRNTCLSANECAHGLWCKHSRARCELCMLPGLPAMPGAPAVTFCETDSPLPVNAAAAIWSGVLNSLPDDALHVHISDYASHCVSCFSPEAGYAFYPMVLTAKIDNMRAPDHMALIFVAILIALCATNELRDVQLGALIASKVHPAVGWRVTFWLLDALRRFAILGCLPNTVCSLVSIRGADTLNICLNAVAVVFVLEVDNLLYEHGTSAALREWCTEHARPSLTRADERAIGWARIASMAGVTSSILVGLQLERLKTSLESARMVALAVCALATVPPLLAEAAAQCSGRALASMLVQFGLAYAILVFGVADVLPRI